MTLAPMRRVALAGLVAGACALMPVAAVAAPAPTLSMTPIGTYATGEWDSSASEITALDWRSKRLFVVNAHAGTVDVVDVADPTKPVKIGQLETPGANSVDVRNGLVAVAEQAPVKTDNGTVSFFDARTLAKLNTVEVGPLPDMVTFLPQRSELLVANEGEPEGYLPGQVDPEGSVSLIDVRQGAARATVKTIDFRAFDADELRAKGVRIAEKAASAAHDLEPEYIAVDPAGYTAWVTLQENNAIAIIDIKKATVTDIVPLGTIDHSRPGFGLDASDRDGKINIANWPVKGLPMPDSIASFTVLGKNYTIHANEGDARDYDGWVDEARVKSLKLDPVAFPNAKALQNDAAIGRLNVVVDSPKGPNGYTELWSYGSRSVSIRDAAGTLLWDSGDALEQMAAAFDPASFNGEGRRDGSFSFDDRSDNKGPEPEGIATGQIGRKTYAFVGLERFSAIAVFDISNPRAPIAQGLFRNAGDFAPEGLRFVPADQSPNKKPLLIVGNELSGTTTLWEIKA